MIKKMETAIGIMVGAILVSLWVSIQVAENHDLPLSEWVKVEKMEIPDFKVGDNPLIVFPVEIKKDLTMSWKSRVLSTIYAGQAVCEAGDTIKLKAGYEENYKRIGDISGGCKLTPGQYYLTYEMSMDKPGYGHKSIKKTSNIFEVK
jgi:hypothetical protein